MVSEAGVVAMYWLVLACYFAGCLVGVVIAFAAYAKLLKLIARFSKLRLVLGIPIYLCMASVLMMPLVLGPAFLRSLNENFSDAPKEVLLWGGFICVVLGFLYFRKRHLKELKDLGYFQ
jgi:hypothetical protein